MPIRNKRVKPETSLAKVGRGRKSLPGRPKATEPPGRGSPRHAGDVPLVPSPCGGQQRSGVCRKPGPSMPLTPAGQGKMVPVVDKEQRLLMPTTWRRADRWIKFKKATWFWKKGVLCVRLNEEPSRREMQKIVVGIDPGSKREAFTVKSRAHTYLNILIETVDWVKDAMERRKNARRPLQELSLQEEQDESQDGFAPALDQGSLAMEVASLRLAGQDVPHLGFHRREHQGPDDGQAEMGRLVLSVGGRKGLVLRGAEEAWDTGDETGMGDKRPAGCSWIEEIRIKAGGQVRMP